MKRLKVAINARVLVTDEIRGWSRYTLELMAGLSQRGVQVYLFSDRRIHRELFANNGQDYIIEEQPGLNYLDWEQRVLPGLCHKHQIDLFHCPMNYGVPLWGRFKKILTLHDAIEKVYYDQFKTWQEKWSLNHLKIRSYHYLSQRAADHIITVSHHAKVDLQKSYQLPKNKISVVYEAAGEEFSTHPSISFIELKSIFSQLPPNYFFYVGGLEKRKNILHLLKSYKLSGSQRPLVLAGGTQQERFTFEKTVADMGLAQQVYFLGYVENKWLPALYQQAYCFLYPSSYEGFGLQVVEAMKCGRPVLGSSTTSLGEIIGASEFCFDPEDEDNTAQLLQKIENPDFYNLCLQHSQKRARDFSWEKCIKQTLEIYNKVLDHEWD